MKKFWIISLLSLLGVAAATLLPQTTSGQKGKLRKSENGIPDRFIVVLNEKIDKQAVAPAIESEAAHLTSQYGGNVKEIYSNALKGFVVEMDERSALELSADDRVAFVEQDSLTTGSTTQSGAVWGIDRIDQRSLPLNSAYSFLDTASNVHAYVIDSGIRPTHVEFGGRATADFDALSDGQNGVDCSGHGTHVAGTIGGATYGVAKNVRLHGVRVLPCSGGGLVSHLIMGVDWVTANHIKPAVANISITASGTSSAMDSAIQNSVNAGVTYVVAAGNVNLDACSYSPARNPAAISVGASTNSDQKAGYSNWGSCVDIWAPGSSITSVSHANDFDLRVMSGTSMASPHVAGVAALYLASNPNASPATVVQNLLNTSTNQSLTGLDATSPNKLVYSLLGSAAPSPSPTPTAGRVTIKKRTNVRTPEGTGTASFPFEAVNLASESFTLEPDNQFVDSNITSFGTENTITITEAGVLGWALTSISCIETPADGLPGFTNSTVDIANRTARIVVEQGEDVECTFTSDQLAPTASFASVSGRVTTPDGRGTRNIRLRLINLNTGAERWANTSSFGYYSFGDLEVAHFYVLSIHSSRKIESDSAVRSFTLNEDLSAMNFVVR